MDFTAESQCFVPNLKEPINLGVTLSFHKLEKELVLHVSFKTWYGSF